VVGEVVELQRGGWVPQNEQSSIAEMDRLRSRRHKEKTTERRLMTIAYTPREKCRRRTWTCSSTDSVSLRVETIFHVVYIRCKKWHDMETCSLFSLSSESYTNAGSRELCDSFSYFISS